MFAGSSPVFTPETLVIYRFVRKLNAQSVKTLLDLIDGAEQSFSTNAQHSDATYSRLQQYKLEARAIRDMLEVPKQPTYIDPCRDSGDVIDAVTSTYSAAQERAFSALRSPVGPNSILQNAQGLTKGAQHRLASHEGIQEDLTDQMVSLASKLKQQAHAQAQALHERDAVLDSASQGLLKSVQGVQTVVKDTKQAVKRTRRSMFFSFFVLLTVAAVFLGVYGYINVTAVTKIFVPYNTMASQWARNNAPAAKELRHGVQQESPLPPKPSGVNEPPIKDLEEDLTASGEAVAAVEPLEGTMEEVELSGSDRIGTVDSGDDGNDSTQQDSTDRETGAADISVSSLDCVHPDHAAEEAVEVSDHPALQQPRDQAKGEQGQAEDEYAAVEDDEEKHAGEGDGEDEYADEDPVADVHAEQGHHGTVQQNEVLVDKEGDAQEPSFEERDGGNAPDELSVAAPDEGSGGIDATAAHEAGPEVQDSFEARPTPPQAVMPQDGTSETSLNTGSLSVQDTRVQDTGVAEAVSPSQEQPELDIPLADPGSKQDVEEVGESPGARPQGDAGVKAEAALSAGHKIVPSTSMDVTAGPTQGISAEADMEHEETKAANVLKVETRLPAEGTGATPKPAAQGTANMAAQDAFFDSAAGIAREATAASSSDAGEAGTSDPGTVQRKETLADTDAQLHQQHGNAPDGEDAATQGVYEGDLYVETSEGVGQDPGMAAAGDADEEDEYYDPPEFEEPAIIDAEDGEAEDNEEDEDDDEEEEDEDVEEDEDLEEDDDDEYYDEPESSEDPSPSQAKVEYGSDPVVSDASDECGATGASGCRTLDTPVQDLHDVLQTAAWEPASEVRTEGGHVPDGVKVDSVSEVSRHDASSVHSAVTSGPELQSRDEL